MYLSLTDVGPASVMVGNLVQGNRLASAQGRELGPMDNEDGMRRVSFFYVLKDFNPCTVI